MLKTVNKDGSRKCRSISDNISDKKFQKDLLMFHNFQNYLKRQKIEYNFKCMDTSDLRFLPWRI